MKENILDILLFVFDNYYIGSGRLPNDPIDFSFELHMVGFSQREIDGAIHWLQVLNKKHQQGAPILKTPCASNSIRAYDARELSKLDMDSRALLQSLQNKGLLAPIARELIIDSVMMIGAEKIELDDFKSLIGLVMFNHPDMYDVLQLITELTMTKEEVYH